jgi:hypothetical protein
MTSIHNLKAFGVVYRQHTIEGMVYLLSLTSAKRVAFRSKEDLFRALLKLEGRYDIPQQAALVKATRANFRRNKSNRSFAQRHPHLSHLEKCFLGPIPDSEAKAATDFRPTLRVCDVCYEETPLHGFPDEKIARNCNHKASTCSTCVAEAMEAQVRDGRWATMKCCACGSDMTPEEIHAVSRPETIEVYVVSQIGGFDIRDEYLLMPSSRYDRFMAEKRMREHPNYRACLNAACGKGMIHEAGDAQPRVDCPHCGSQTCFVHERPFHHGYTCEEWDGELRLQAKHLDDEAASASFMKFKTKNCPGEKVVNGVVKPCRVLLSRAGGCHHFSKLPRLQPFGRGFYFHSRC